MNFLEVKENVYNKLIEVNVPKSQAIIVSDALATADLYGVTTHGSRILSSHLDRVKRGGYNLTPDFVVLRETAAFAVIDGDNAMGFVSANYCMRYAVEKCKNSGIYHVFSRNNNTLGAAFYYPLKAAEKGMIGLVCCNSPAQMAPSGGKNKMLGTNPFAAVIPVPSKEPIIIDMATSVVAKSKFKKYKEQGKLLPNGWALDKDGTPTNDPDEGIQGLVLPMAGYKGYGIAMLIDILSGVMSGAAYLNKVGKFYSEDCTAMNVGFCFAAIDPKVVIGENYPEIINDFVSRLRNSEPIEKNMIRLPGDGKIKAKLSHSE